MTWDREKLQKLTDFDFSQEGAHIAIVGKGANGKEKFLVKKSLGTKLQKALDPNATYEQLEDQAMQISTTMPLADLLELQGLWRYDALVIASAINKSEDPVDSKEKLEKFIEGLDLETDKGKSNIDKSEEQSMADKDKEVVAKEVSSDEFETVSKALGKSQESEEALKKELEDIKKAKADIEKAKADLEKETQLLKAAEAERINKAYADKAESFSELGFTKEDGVIFKAVEAVEGGAKILEALTKAQDILKADGDTDTLEAGHGREESATGAMDELKAIAKSLQVDDEKLSDVEALNKAVKANPALYSKYVEEGAK